ncbi:unnamed protein product, partial [marine sediment metagenome]
DNIWHNTGAAVVDAAWHHIVCLLDDANDVLKMYVDCNEVYVGSCATSIAADDLFSLGQEYDGLVVSDFLSGFIDEVAIYNRVLSYEEIQQLYNPRIVGDINNDHIVNFLDYIIMAGDWRKD